MTIMDAYGWLATAAVIVAVVLTIWRWLRHHLR